VKNPECFTKFSEPKIVAIFHMLFTNLIPMNPMLVTRLGSGVSGGMDLLNCTKIQKTRPNWAKKDQKICSDQHPEES
jgi:hypothetical protein